MITDDNNDNSNNDNYRYNDNQPLNKIDSLKMKLEKEKEIIKDSLQKAKEKIEQQLEKFGDNSNPEPISYNSPDFNAMININ